MDKLNILNRVKELYLQDENIIKYLKQLDSRKVNNIEDILISYDFQAGTYIKAYKQNPDVKREIGNKLANLIQSLGEFSSILEVGVGEATTLGNTISSLEKIPERVYGFDLSWQKKNVGTWICDKVVFYS